MDNLSKSQDQFLDDQLSEFTDRLLSGENETGRQETVSDRELSKLQESVVRVKAAIQQARPNPTVSIRIRTRLLKEWKQQTNPPKRFLLKDFFWPFPRLAIAGGALIAFILSVTTFFIPATPWLPGAAGGFQTWTPFFILVGVILIVLFFWFDHRS